MYYRNVGAYGPLEPDVGITSWSMVQLLTLIRAEETHARAPQEATEALSNAVRNYD
jgi:hypothetical protein